MTTRAIETDLAYPILTAIETTTAPTTVEKEKHLSYRLLDLMKKLSPIIQDLEDVCAEFRKKTFSQFDEKHDTQYSYAYWQGIALGASGLLSGVAQIGIGGDGGRAISSILSSGGQFGERALHAESTLKTKNLELIRSNMTHEEPTQLKRLDELLKQISQEITAHQREEHQAAPRLSR